MSANFGGNSWPNVIPYGIAIIGPRSSGDDFDAFIISLRPFAKCYLAGQDDSIKMNPSLAVFSGLKRVGIDFATSVPCVNLQVQWIVSTDEQSADEAAERDMIIGRAFLSPGPGHRTHALPFIFNRV